MLYTVSAKRPTIDVTSIVENELQEKFQTVTGVGDVIVYGGRRREIHIYANPDRLRAYNLTVSDVAQALRAQNMELPAGRIDAGSQELSIRALGRIERAGQFFRSRHQNRQRIPDSGAEHRPRGGDRDRAAHGGKARR